MGFSFFLVFRAVRGMDGWMDGWVQREREGEREKEGGEGCEALSLVVGFRSLTWVGDVMEVQRRTKQSYHIYGGCVYLGVFT